MILHQCNLRFRFATREALKTILGLQLFPLGMSTTWAARLFRRLSSLSAVEDSTLLFFQFYTKIGSRGAWIASRLQFLAKCRDSVSKPRHSSFAPQFLFLLCPLNGP